MSQACVLSLTVTRTHCLNDTIQVIYRVHAVSLSPPFKGKPKPIPKIRIAQRGHGRLPCSPHLLLSVMWYFCSNQSILTPCERLLRLTLLLLLCSNHLHLHTWPLCVRMKGSLDSGVVSGGHGAFFTYDLKALFIHLSRQCLTQHRLALNSVWPRMSLTS